MAKVLIVMPDPQNPGGVTLGEFWNVEKVWMESSGVLCVQHEADGDTVYYSPSAWHSWTLGNYGLMGD